MIASMAYSTWKIRPSGENVFTPRSYSLRVKNMARTERGEPSQCSEQVGHSRGRLGGHSRPGVRDLHT